MWGGGAFLRSLHNAGLFCYRRPLPLPRSVTTAVPGWAPACPLTPFPGKDWQSAGNSGQEPLKFRRHPRPKLPLSGLHPTDGKMLKRTATRSPRVKDPEGVEGAGDTDTPPRVAQARLTRCKLRRGEMLGLCWPPGDAKCPGLQAQQQGQALGSPIPAGVDTGGTGAPPVAGGWSTQGLEAFPKQAAVRCAFREGSRGEGRPEDPAARWWRRRQSVEFRAQEGARTGVGPGQGGGGGAVWTPHSPAPSSF